MADTQDTTREELRLFAQGWVWASADHECGGNMPGICTVCDSRAQSLTNGVSNILQPSEGSAMIQPRPSGRMTICWCRKNPCECMPTPLVKMVCSLCGEDRQDAPCNDGNSDSHAPVVASERPDDVCLEGSAMIPPSENIDALLESIDISADGIREENAETGGDYIYQEVGSIKAMVKRIRAAIQPPSERENLDWSPCGHYLRTPVEDTSPTIKAAFKLAFKDEPDLVERLNRLRKLIVAVLASERVEHRTTETVEEAKAHLKTAAHDWTSEPYDEVVGPAVDTLIAAVRQEPRTTREEEQASTPGENAPEIQQAREQLEQAIAQLRHAYQQLLQGAVKNQHAFARGLLGPVVEKLEQYHLLTVSRQSRQQETTV